MAIQMDLKCIWQKALLDKGDWIAPLPSRHSQKHIQLHPFWKCHAGTGTRLAANGGAFTAYCAVNNLRMRRIRLIISA